MDFLLITAPFSTGEFILSGTCRFPLLLCQAECSRLVQMAAQMSAEDKVYNYRAKGMERILQL
jgi:hypothetical protein